MPILPLTCLVLAAALGTAPSRDTLGATDTISPADAYAPVPLTVDALTRMTTFWTLFRQEPPAISDTARATYHTILGYETNDWTHRNMTCLAVEEGSERRVRVVADCFQPDSFTVVDMVALAAHEPAVAADLTRAHLTAVHWEQLRRALYFAVLVVTADTSVASLDGGIEANLRFVQSHRPDLQRLQAAGMWLPRRMH
ncbi:MAG TPA: hypothetical protein VNU46_06425 [Gemmatimonadaceae bacterium]|jgi:hypothetical protein|nr:hypothetical protein [Gemmatimonadaceae bacterium]